MFSEQHREFIDSSTEALPQWMVGLSGIVLGVMLVMMINQCHRETTGSDDAFGSLLSEPQSVSVSANIQ